MEINIIANSSRGALEFHQRFVATADCMSYDTANRRLSLKFTTAAWEFSLVKLVDINSSGITLSGIDQGNSATKSFLILITFD